MKDACFELLCVFFLKALKCLISWVQFGVTIMDLENVLPVVFDATRNPELFDTTVDLLVEIATHPSGSR